MKLRVDQKFEPARASITYMEIEINTLLQNEHVTYIERLNKTAKERIWSVYKDMIQVYCRVLDFLMRKLVYDMMFWLGSFPVMDDISATISARAMINS